MTPCGPEFGVGSANSLNCSVDGSKRPTTLARWPVYQIDPSGATAGSCGYGGLLGVIHSWILTSTVSAGEAVTIAMHAAARPMLNSAVMEWRTEIRRRVVPE